VAKTTVGWNFVLAGGGHVVPREEFAPRDIYPAPCTPVRSLSYASSPSSRKRPATRRMKGCLSRVRRPTAGSAMRSGLALPRRKARVYGNEVFWCGSPGADERHRRSGTACYREPAPVPTLLPLAMPATGQLDDPSLRPDRLSTEAVALKARSGGTHDARELHRDIPRDPLREWPANTEYGNPSRWGHVRERA
jgi:hypothetical protein